MASLIGFTGSQTWYDDLGFLSNNLQFVDLHQYILLQGYYWSYQKRLYQVGPDRDNTSFRRFLYLRYAIWD